MHPAAPESKRPRLSGYLRRFLTTALIVCPVFVAITAAYWFQGLHEDFPEERFWDPLVGFFIGFPLLIATGGAAPLGLPQTAYVFVGVAIDGLFWAVAGVSIHELLQWLV